jgi:hypothetical protein
MLEKDVPQDKGMAEGLKTVCYAVDEKGDYVMASSLGWEASQIANDQAWELIHAELEIVRKQIRDRKKSMLAYHMTKHLMDLALLAQYAGFSRLRVRWHMRPTVFAKLPSAILQNYARIFGISIEALTDRSPLDSEENLDTP